MKKRLDIVLLEKGLFESRTKAQAMIMAGKILVNNQKVDKAGSLVDENHEIRILGEILPYVSRGGLKLAQAIIDFNVIPKDRVCLDIGASTGGFSDCLLQNGAKKIFAIDVGYGQLDLKVRNNPKVVVIEKTNARNSKSNDIYEDGEEKASLAVMDVSFISILKILPALRDLLAENGEIVSLVKPQFEAGREFIGKGGIIKDPSVHEKVLEDVIQGSKEAGFEFIAKTQSSIYGADGNKEFFIYIKKSLPQ